MRDQVLCLREKVKERLSNLDDYQAFLKCIVHYRTENITRPQLQSLVNSFIHYIIIKIFIQFLVFNY